jgi:hypothetical protein
MTWGVMAKGIRAEDRSAWEQRGGRIRTDAKGRPVYVIRKQIGGHRYEVSTRKHTLAAALAEWERFEKDPDRYQPAGAPGTGAIYLDNALSVAFVTWSLNDKGNSAAWVRAQKSALAWWMERLGGVDLRRATVRDNILPPLEGAPGRPHKIEVIKAFFGWLRKVQHVITAADDCTLDLAVPQAKPAQWVKSKVIPREHYLLVRDALTSPWREALIVLAGTGWHVSELSRFAEAGTIDPLPPAMKVEHGAVGVLVCPRHKSGDMHRTAVSQEVLDAAKHLLARGYFARDRLEKVIRAACAAVKRPDGGIGIPMFTPARFRHSVATWAIEAGASPESVAAFLGHKSMATTRKFYATLATVPKVPTLA